MSEPIEDRAPGLPWWKRPFLQCAVRMCPFEQIDGKDGIWGECMKCGATAGYVSRAALRAYADRDLARRPAPTPGEQHDRS